MASSYGSEYTPPSLDEFFPRHLFVGTPFEMTRINLIMFVATGAIVLVFGLAFRRPQLVPKGIQNVGEIAVDFVRINVAEEMLGSKGKKYVPYLAALFFFIFFFNIIGIIPPFMISPNSLIAVPMVLAIVSWVVFNVAGIRKHGFGHYMKMNLFPPGVPVFLYILLTPIEAISTFILRPITLTIRLMANMMAGHLLLVLFYGSTTYLFFHAVWWLRPLGVGTYIAGFGFTLFEILVAVLQAYIFTLLTTVYIAGAISDEH
jgi:F-type H+-transporting ATPase subunit a